MLNLFGKLQIPDVPHVDVYQDDEDDTKFWMVPQRLRAAIGDNGKPSVGLCAFARDLSLLAGVGEALPKGETEGGLLSMTLECTVSEEDQAKIAGWLKSNVLAPAMPWFMPRMYDDGCVRFWAREPIAEEPKLAYPLWTSGEAQLCLPSALGGTFVKGDDAKVKPSLTSSNVASFTTLLGQEGVRLFREGMKSGLLPAHVAYSLQFAARLPALHIEIAGSRTKVYEQLVQHSTIVQMNGFYVRIFPVFTSLQVLKEKCSDLTIKFDENQLATAGNADLVKKLQDMALGLVQGVLQSMFAQPVINGQVDKDKLGTDPMQNYKPPGTPVTGANQLWLKELEQQADETFSFTFDGNITKTFSTYPNAALLGIVSLDELKSGFIEADLNTPIFQILDVPVRVTADFDRDPIADIQVVVDYDEVDDITGQRKTQHKTFDYIRGNEVNYFRTVMAKRADGSPKNTYRYSTQLNYKASSAPVVTPTETTNKQSLMLGYDNLSCVSVKCTSGDVPWTVVDSVVVDLRLPDVDLPSATAQVVLTPSASTGSWFTYTGQASASGPVEDADPAENSAGHRYHYDTTFHLKDGQRLLVKGPADGSTAGTLLMQSPFVDRLDAVFMPAGSTRPVQQIVLSVKYTDEKAGYCVNDTHVFSGTPQPWAWSVEILDKTKRSFQYKADISYADGSTTPGEWKTQHEEGTVTLGEPARGYLDVTVTPAVLDMAKWKLVMVKLRYPPPPSPNATELPSNELVQETTLQFKLNETTDKGWRVTLKDPTKRSFSYEVTAYPVEGPKRVVPMAKTDDPFLALEL